jgi:hypothetical protein
MTAPPSRSTNSAQARGDQVLEGASAVGLQLGQTEPGSVTSMLATCHLQALRAKYALLAGLGAAPMAPTRASMFASMELSTGGIGYFGG